ncbi:MAG: 3'-5' exonuclease [Legionellales bacterium]|nr:3'-5' exonuclease [Legionellales bacterium]|tara:strand:+ start:35002 stop:35784 length:783 start_codon:yes stop_codon:yes gene_type:complete
MNPIFVFDIETIPDVNAGRKLHEFTDLDDQAVAEAMFAKRRAETDGSDFLPHYLHQIVAISVVLRSRDSVKVWSLGDLDANEAELLERFYSGIARFTPTLVSWNGSGFDLPVIHYRSLVHGVAGPRYWETGADDNQFRYNNYLNRYHERHTDLMDVLAGFQARANAPLDKIATMLGFPGKMGMSGANVWDNYCAGDLAGIRNYCETDVLNTYLVYLRFEMVRGHISESQYLDECQLLQDTLETQAAEHLQAFLQQWQAAG